MDAACERIEPVLCFALSEADKRDWRPVHGALSACTAYAELHRAPSHAEYGPSEVLQRIVRTAAGRAEFIGGHAERVAGDVEQMVAAARALLQNAALEHDAVLRVGVAELDGVPAWQFAIDGPGHFPERIAFGYDLAIDRSELESIWTSATRGGRIDSRPGQIDLRLKGVRAAHGVPVGCDSVVAALREAEARARVLASGEFAALDADALGEGLRRILADFDAQDDSSQPCDLSVLVREVAIATSEQPGPVTFEFTVATDLPPLSVRRNRLVRLFRASNALGRAALTHGGSVRCNVDYSVSERTASVTVTGQGRVDRAAAERWLPSIDRAASVHGGETDAEFADDGFLVLLTVPDAVALTLDSWLPGWDTFAPRSIQMLRLLKSGGPVPPEDLILGGVLEDELERRLLPRLGVAPAATLVHELQPRRPALGPSSPARLEKVLSQLKRGKPKKEICAPPYAAEVLWMFAVDERHAAAVGVAPGQLSEVEGLCKVLIESPIDYALALRLVAQMLEPPVE